MKELEYVMIKPSILGGGWLDIDFYRRNRKTGETSLRQRAGDERTYQVLLKAASVVVLNPEHLAVTMYPAYGGELVGSDEMIAKG